MLHLDHYTLPAGTSPVTLNVNGDGGVAGCAIVDTCVTQVTVNDIESPTVDCNSHATFDMDSSWQMPLKIYDLAFSWYDSCAWEDISVSVPGGIPTFGCEHVGTMQQVTVEATDLAGNTGTCDAYVEVTDWSVRIPCPKCFSGYYQNTVLAHFPCPFSTNVHLQSPPAKPRKPLSQT